MGTDALQPRLLRANPTSIVWDRDATCPKFDALLEFGLPPDDIKSLLALVRLCSAYW
jgi:hypothetical protein